MDRKVLQAADALRDGRALDAVRYQEEALELARQQRLEHDVLIMQLALAGYLVHAGERARAVRIYQEVGARARQLNRGDLAAQAFMGAGTLLLLNGEVDNASSTFVQAAEAAMFAGLPPLALEGYRLAGQAQADAGRPELAARHWRAALETVGADVREFPTGSAIEAGRALVALYRRQGLEASARTLEIELERLASGPSRGY